MKWRLDLTTALNELRDIYRDELLNSSLRFWLRFSIDREHGGYITSLDRDGAVLDTDKSVWQQGRFAWLLSKLFNRVQPNTEWLETARLGIDFLDRFCFDPSDGRMWFHVTRDGRPLRKRRYSYSECFAAIAFGEFAEATGNEEWAARAETLFEGFVSAAWSSEENPKYEPTRPTRSIGYPMCTINTAQELRDSIGLTSAAAWIDRSIEAIEKLHVKEDLQCVMETVSPDGGIIDHFDGRQLNPGHAIEAAWFIMREGKHRRDTRLIQLGCKMLDYMFPRAWDDQYGGLLYFVDLLHKPVQEYWHDMKFWWPHNETIIATLLAYQLTGDKKYLGWHAEVHDWSYAHFPDPVHGDWFGYLRRDGIPSSRMKGNLWKGPFHLPRMQLVCWKLLDEMLSVAEPTTPKQ